MFRFTIRDELWLTIVIARAIGWWLDRSNLAGPAEEYRRLTPRQIEAARAHGNKELFDAIGDVNVQR